MHELSLMEGVLDLILEARGRQPFDRVLRVVLELGPRSGAEPEALRFGWEAVAEGTVAEGAVLDLVAVPALAFCVACGRDAEVASVLDDCPGCGGPLGPLRGEGGLVLKSLEVD